MEGAMEGERERWEGGRIQRTERVAAHLGLECPGLAADLGGDLVLLERGRGDAALGAGLNTSWGA